MDIKLKLLTAVAVILATAPALAAQDEQERSPDQELPPHIRPGRPGEQSPGATRAIRPETDSNRTSMASSGLCLGLGRHECLLRRLE